MNKNKIIWIFVLITFIAIIFFVTNKISKRAENINNDASNTKIINARKKVVYSNESLQNEEDISKNNNLSQNDITEYGDTYIRTELATGTLYSKTGKEIKADIVIGDNYFDTTINDMHLNPNTYKGKTIEIEGFYVSNLPYTFVGRYSASNLCPYCAPGYSYMEYQLDGTIDVELTNEQEWIKIVGLLEVGNDESSDYKDYFYLKVLSLEIMNERGQEVVNN